MPQSSFSVEKLFVHVTFPHRSLAVAPPLTDSQFCKTSCGLIVVHEMVLSCACTSIEGPVASFTVSVATEVVIFPHSSVAANVTTVLPLCPHPLLNDE